MERNFVRELINGVGVIIDNDLQNERSDAFCLAKSLKEENVPIVCYNKLPDKTIINSFANVSFVILDWDFSDGITTPDGEKIDLGSEGKHDQEENALFFLLELIKKVFVPIFIVTQKDIEDIKNELTTHGVVNEENDFGIIMISSKTDIKDYNSLIDNIGEWFEKTPSALALKIWEKRSFETKNNMFLDLYNASPDWVNVLLKTIKKDTKSDLAVNREMTELINNNFINRMEDGNFCQINRSDKKPNSEEIRKVLNGERFYTYKNTPEISYLGDLYKCDDIFILNIRAQCDLMRSDNPILYIIIGKAISLDKVSRTGNIKLSKNGTITINRKHYSLEEIKNYSEKDIDVFNSNIEEFNKNLFFLNGDLLDKKTEITIPCVAGEQLIKFDFKTFKTCEKEKLDNNAVLIGRIMPPYITKIQKCFFNYAIREGLMSTPEELFNF